MPRVLAVDDNADIRFLVRKFLEDEGHEVTEAASGPDCIGALALGPLPDLVILDVQMPDMDGWDTLTRIRSDAATAHVPVIMATVKSSPESKAQGYALRCNGYVGKPFDFDELSRQVRAVLSGNDGRANGAPPSQT